MVHRNPYWVSVRAGLRVHMGTRGLHVQKVQYTVPAARSMSSAAMNCHLIQRRPQTRRRAAWRRCLMSSASAVLVARLQAAARAALSRNASCLALAVFRMADARSRSRVRCQGPGQARARCPPRPGDWGRSAGGRTCFQRPRFAGPHGRSMHCLLRLLLIEGARSSF